MNTISLTRTAALVRQGQAGPWNQKSNEPIAYLECINSRADMYGNRYWAFVWTDRRGNSVSATISGGESNITSVIREMGLDFKRCWYTRREDVPIREYNRLVRDWPRAGCRSEDIAKFIKSQINNPLMDQRIAQAGPWNAGRTEEELNRLRSRVKTHGGYPAVNVKVRNGFSYRDVMDHFQCSEQEAERVGQIYWDAACEDFWRYWGDEGAQNPAQQHFGGGVKIYSEGRSNGWLVVNGLPEIEAWDSDTLKKWDKFETDVEADVKWRMSKEQAIEAIESSQWIEQGA